MSRDGKLDRAASFIANITHEALTPLNAILGFAELIRDDPDDPCSEDHAEFADDILVSAEQLVAVIHDSLDLVRGATGTIEYRPLPTDFQTVARRVLINTSSLGEKHSVSCALHLGEPRRVYGVADPAKLERILSAFVTWAISRSPDVTHVSVRIDGVEGTGIRCSVLDDGPTPDRDAVLNYFGPFNSPDGPYRSALGRTGIELTLAALYAEAMGGYAEVFTPDEGGLGAAITLPLGFPMGHAPKLPTEGYVLVADPNRRHREMACVALKAAGLEATPVASGVDALIAAHAERPLAIIMDPSPGSGIGRDGFLTATRSTERFAETPVVIWSDDAQAVDQALASATVAKLDGPSAFLSALSSLLPPNEQ